MKRILLVDDVEDFRQTISKTLERAGYEVQTAPDGAAALQLYHQHPVDLIIIDLLMPGKEGLETIMELRQLQPALKIIAMSGGGRIDARDYLTMATTLGATTALEKPFTSQELLQTVASLWREPEPPR
jgi:CheY-like chemotaxis protein